MFKRILVPMALDHGIGETALSTARSVLADSGEIQAIHVLAPPNPSIGAYLDDKVVTRAFDVAEARLDKRASGQNAVSAKVLRGHTARTIVDYASEIGADCIVIGAHKPGLANYFLGSTAAWVVRRAPCTVYVLRPSEQDSKREHIVAMPP